MGTYYRNHIWDIILTLIMSISLSYVVFAGYETKDSRATSVVWITAICAVCVILLFLAGYNRRTMLAGIGAGVVGVIVAVIAIRSFQTSDGGTIDKNPALFWMVTIGVSVVCYILTRWRLSTVILLVGAAVMCAAYGFLKYPINRQAYLVFMCAILVMFLYRVYDRSLLSSYTGSVRYGRYTTQTLAFVLVIMIAAGGLYYGVLRPMKLPTHPLKLITRLESLEILQKVGISRETEIPNQQNQTKNKNDQNENTNQKNDQQDNTQAQQKRDENQQGDLQQQTDTEKTQAVNYHQSRLWLYILIAVIIALAVITPFVVRHLMHKRWENKVKAAGPTEGSVMIYDYLTKKLRYAGFTKPPEVTLLRYMRGQRRAMKGFAVGTTDLLALTRMYQEVIYGCRELDKREFSRFWKVYEAFRENMKKKLGKVKYALRFFFI